MGTVRIWLSATRPKTLPAAVSPVLLGTAIAYSEGVFHGLSALAALFGAIFIQVGTNFANDYFDFVKGADTKDRLGPTRATQAGLVRPESMKTAFLLAFAVAMVIGLYLVWRGGSVIVLIGLISIALGILYTATRYALAYTGFADIFVLIFFGPIAVGGTYYVQALSLSVESVIAGFAPGFISVAILTVNNLRDIVQDTQANKNTLAVRFGAAFARREYLVSLAIAFSVPVLLWLVYGTSPLVMLPLLAIGVIAPKAHSVLSGTSGAKLNSVLAETGKFLLVFSILFSIGWLI